MTPALGAPLLAAGLAAGAAAVVLALVPGRWRSRRAALMLCLSGLLLIALGGLGVDWRIPGCRDAHGQLIDDNPRCVFP